MRKRVTLIITALTFAATLAFPHRVFNLVAADVNLREVAVYNNGEQQLIWTGAPTVQTLLYEMGITLCDGSRTNFAPQSPLWSGITIAIERNMGFNVQIDNQAVQPVTAWPNTTVAQVITQLQNENNLPLIYGGNYTRYVEAGETLHVKSLQARLEVERVQLPYATHENHTNTVWGGRSHVRQTGSLGEKEITTEIIYIGGVEQNRKVVSDIVLIEPVDAIVDIGTARLGARADVTAADFHYVRRVRMEATAYTAGYGCTGKHPDDPWFGITASGRRVEHGIVAVDRQVIPLGTHLYVEGYGFAIAADVGGAIRGYKIDLFMENLSDALRFGRRHLYVWILE